MSRLFSLLRRNFSHASIYDMRTKMKQLVEKSTYFFLKRTALGSLYREADFRAAKRILLCSDALSGEEKALLDKVVLRLHPNDGMYVPSCAQHYISVGLSAVRCI